jgi:hypothetical protein
MHIGDGRFTALYPDGTFAQPVPWDERCYLNVTTSICDDDAFEGARIHYAGAFSTAEKLPAAVFLCSDGVDDNYPVEGNEEYLYKLYRIIALTFVDDGFDSTCDQLKGLANSFANNGKGDDTSIAGIIDMEAVKAIAPLLREQAAADDRKGEEEKAAKAEAARQAAKKAESERAARAARTEAARIATEKAVGKARPAAKTAVEPPEEKSTAGSEGKSKTIEKALAAIEACEQQNKLSADLALEDYGKFKGN